MTDQRYRSNVPYGCLGDYKIIHDDLVKWPSSKEKLWTWLDTNMEHPFAWCGPSTAHYYWHIFPTHEIDVKTLLNIAQETKYSSEWNIDTTHPTQFLTLKETIQFCNWFLYSHICPEENLFLFKIMTSFTPILMGDIADLGNTHYDVNGKITWQRYEK